MFRGAFFFDSKGMNHALVTTASLSIVSLVLACGCASSPSRSDNTHADEHESHAQTHHVWIEGSTSISSDGSSDASSNEVYDFVLPDTETELIIGTIFADEFIPHYHAPITGYTIEEIQAELEEMYDLDQELVKNTVHPFSEVHTAPSTIRAIDQAHSDRLKEIVAHIGWPTRDLVGLKATQAAYMVIQHAGHDNDFQNQCLAMMVDLVEQGELPASYVALLTDRIRVFQELPQVFGTQMAMTPNEFGVMSPTPTVPIEDPEHLDDRRKLMGMPPHSEFVGAIEVAYQASLVDPGTAFAEVFDTE